MSGECFLCRQTCQNKCEHCVCVYYCSQNHLKVHRPAERCMPFIIRHRPEVGNHVVASRKICAGEVVISDYPAATGPAPKTSPTCLNCLRDWSGEVNCGVCGWPVCGEECQNGTNHQMECALLKACPSDKRPDFRGQLSTGHAPYHASILPLRLLLLQSTKPHSSERVELLMDNIDVISKEESFQERWEHPVLDFLVNTVECGFTREQILRAIGILCTNAIAMAYCNGNSLYPTFSFLSHSCVSNCRFFLHPQDKVIVRAQIDIAEGEEVTIPYMNPALGSAVRRPTLHSNWRFQCQCARCQDPSELGTNSSAIRCRRCEKESNSSGFILSSDTNNLEANWTCSFCGYVVNNSTMIALVRTIEANISDNKHDLEDLEKLLESLERLLHSNHYLLLELKKKWIKMISEKEETFTNPEALEKIIDYIAHIMQINGKLEPGFTLTLGENLKILNKSMMTLAKLKVNNKQMSKLELISVARKAAANVKIAEKCFEDSD